MGPAQMQHTMPCGEVNWGQPVITWSSLRTTGEQAKTRIRKLQFGNQTSLDNANPILTESYGNWGTRRSPAFGAAREQEISWARNIRPNRYQPATRVQGSCDG